MRRALLTLLALAVVTAAGAEYRRKLSKTYVFSRGQWHYNPVLNYSGRWTDIPLLLDPEMGSKPRGGSSPEALAAMEKNALRYGLDGLASLRGKGTPELIRMLEENNVPGFILLPEIYATGVGMYKEGLPLDKMRASTDLVFLPAAKSPITLKFKGKTIISSYNADDPGRTPEFWRELLADYRRTEGDKFLFLPLLERPAGLAWHNYRTQFEAGKLTAERQEIIKDHLRKYARACDGIYLGCAPVRPGNRRTDIEFFKLMIQMATEVLAEPEFKDKLFAVAARIGHENATRVGYIRGSFGTWCYRETMKAVLEVNPDIIVIPEWDEQNENTSLRPTRAGMSTFARITRVLLGLSADLPGDDKSVPDLIVSYRKVIALGEAPEFELLGLPDEGGAATARLALFAPDGKKVFQSQEYSFSGKAMEEHRFQLPTEQFAAYPFLMPELTVTRGGSSRSWRDGLHFIKLEPVSNCDYQYVKQPLRDLIAPKTAEIAWQNPTQVTVKFDAGEPLAFAEILDDNMPVWAATADGKPYWRENDAEKVFAITFQNLGNYRDQLRGKLSVPGVPEARWMHDTTAGWPTRITPSETGAEYAVDFNQRIEITRFMLAVPAAKAETATLKVDIPGYFTADVPLAQVLKNHSFGVPGQKSPVMTVARQDFQLLQVKKLRRNQVEFTATLSPHSVRSVLNFQAITESGRVWRSAPVSVERPSQKTGSITVYSEIAKKPVTLTVPESRIPVYDYRYALDCGTAMPCSAGLRYCGVAGGFPAHHDGRLGARRDSTVFIATREFPAKGARTSATLGKTGWELGAPGQHLALPTGVISRRAAFTVTLDLTQTDGKGVQTILDNSAGMQGLLKVTSKDGAIKVEVLTDMIRWYEFATGLVLPENQPSTLVIRYELDRLTVTLNGKTYTAPCGFPGNADTVTSVGGGRFGSFKGEIRRITVDYHQPGAAK